MKLTKRSLRKILEEEKDKDTKYLSDEEKAFIGGRIDMLEDLLADTEEEWKEAPPPTLPDGISTDDAHLYTNRRREMGG